MQRAMRLRTSEPCVNWLYHFVGQYLTMETIATTDRYGPLT